VIEALHFIPGQTCSMNSSVILSDFPLSLRSCLDQLDVVSDVAAAIAPNFVISDDAVAYSNSLKSFLWDTLCPASVSAFGLVCIPKVLKFLHL
jgi:hypothetical protein